MASRFSAWLRRAARASVLSRPKPRVRPTLAHSIWSTASSGRPTQRRKRPATAVRSASSGRCRREFPALAPDGFHPADGFPVAAPASSRSRAAASPNRESSGWWARGPRPVVRGSAGPGPGPAGTSRSACMTEPSRGPRSACCGSRHRTVHAMTCRLTRQVRARPGSRRELACRQARLPRVFRVCT